MHKSLRAKTTIDIKPIKHEDYFMDEIEDKSKEIMDNVYILTEENYVQWIECDLTFKPNSRDDLWDLIYFGSLDSLKKLNEEGAYD